MLKMKIKKTLLLPHLKLSLPFIRIELNFHKSEIKVQVRFL